MMRILVFGGTFNPVHNGHVRLCRLAAEAVDADRSIIIPTYAPTYKSTGDQLASCDHRMNMCSLAFDSEKETVSDIEVSSGRPCYTNETLTKLSLMYPDSELYLACGSDMFLTLHQWKNPDIIYKIATICALSRSDDVEVLREYADSQAEFGMRSIIIDAEPYAVSSSQIRRMIKNNEDVSSLLPGSVYDYIKRHGLYL